MMYWHVAKEISFKNIYVLALVAMLFSPAENSEFGKVVQEVMSFKDSSYLELCWPFCSAKQNHLCNFGRGHHEEHFFELF